MKSSSFLISIIFLWFLHQAFGSKIPTEFSGLSSILQSRIKRDDGYEVECHQSGTGLFSFFAVPILLGDVTLDFMNMINVMVDVMVMATAMEGDMMSGTNNNNNNNGEGGAAAGDGMMGNNNNNNNNNMNRRKRSKNMASKKAMDRMQIIEEALNSFEYQPSNNSAIADYERLAKNHINQYFQTLKARRENPKSMQLDIIGSRQIYQAPKQIMVEHLALEFFDQLMQSFHGFKNYCNEINNSHEDCAILDTDLNHLGIEEIKRELHL